MSSVLPRLLMGLSKAATLPLLFVSPASGNIPPTLESGTGYPLIATFVASGGAAPLTYSLITSGLPSGVVIDPTSGILSGLFPPNDFPPAELPTWITPAGQLSGIYNEGSPVSVTLDADPAIGRTLDKFSVIYGILPFGLQLNALTGEIFGVLADVGGGDTTQPNVPPTWTTPAGNIGSVLAENVLAPPLSVSATYNGAATSLRYFIASGALPFGLQLNALTGEIFGTPQSVVGLVEYPAPPTWTTPAGSLGTFAAAATPSIFVVATTAIAYSLVRGTLPFGLQLNGDTGEISGIVEHSVDLASPIVFTLRAHSANDGFADRIFSIVTTP